MRCNTLGKHAFCSRRACASGTRRAVAFILGVPSVSLVSVDLRHGEAAGEYRETHECSPRADFAGSPGALRQAGAAESISEDVATHECSPRAACSHRAFRQGGAAGEYQRIERERDARRINEQHNTATLEAPPQLRCSTAALVRQTGATVFD